MNHNSLSPDEDLRKKKQECRVFIYLDDEGESDPLVVLGELLVFGHVLVGVIHSREGHIDSNSLEECVGYRVRGVNPAESVQ